MCGLLSIMRDLESFGNADHVPDNTDPWFVNQISGAPLIKTFNLLVATVLCLCVTLMMKTSSVHGVSLLPVNIYSPF